MRRTTYIHTNSEGFQEERSTINIPLLLANLSTMVLTGLALGALIFYCLSGGAS